MVKNLLFVMVVISVLSSQSYAGFGDLINKAQKAVENKTERAVSNIGKDDPIKILSDAGFSNYQELKTLTQDIPVDRPDADLSRFEDEDLFQKISQTSEALKQLESDKLIQDTSDQKLAVSSIESFNTAAIQYLHDRDRVIEKYHAQLEEKKRQKEEKERQEKESKRLAAEREKERLKKEAALEKERQEQMALLEKEGQAKEQPKQVTNEDVSRDNPPSIDLSECEKIKNFPLHEIDYAADAKELNVIMSQYFRKPLSDWVEDDFDKYKKTMISCRENDFFRNYGEEDFPDTINESIKILKKEQKEIFVSDQATQQWNALRKESEKLIEKIKDFTISDAELDRLREIKKVIPEVEYKCQCARDLDYHSVETNIQDHLREYQYTLEERARQKAWQEEMDKEKAAQENKDRQRLEAETKEAQELVKKYGKIGPPSDFLMARLHTYVGGELSDMCTVIKFYDGLSGKKKWDKKSDLWVLTQNFKGELTGEKHEFLYAFEDYRVEHSFVLLSRAVMDDEEVPTSQLYRFIMPMLGD
ncbi:hypothetical protein [Desulfosudis oleivorans]|uniref:Uncharacterized protein n=1 Tax=Desulfosudis oleivorans (strain DSM 6200 / JCM 39069 / Hxd3) TaxID=96561 RepID=A8ZXD7_DESOH|nr:hypothetical protein [Desulfosudis oleivorans]ABW68516.1 hypothetical protein Dole_2713 [Desulfosudis oleivorans Hxd3]